MLRNREFRKAFYRYLVSVSLFEAAGMFWVTTIFFAIVAGVFTATGDMPPSAWSLSLLWQVPLLLLVTALASFFAGPFIALCAWGPEKPWRWTHEKLEEETAMHYALIRRPVPLAVGRLLFAWVRKRIQA